MVAVNTPDAKVRVTSFAAAGVAGAELADGRLMPTAFWAMTLITYAVPLVRPVTVHEVAVIGSPEDGKNCVQLAPLLLE